MQPARLAGRHDHADARVVAEVGEGALRRGLLRVHLDPQRPRPVLEVLRAEDLHQPLAAVGPLHAHRASLDLRRGHEVRARVAEDDEAHLLALLREVELV
eukprot:13276714-Alexandrium_andersonii.AAC.1